MSYQLYASPHCLLQMFVCKFIILFYDNGAQRNLKITYNSKLPHLRDIFYNGTDYQVSSKTTEQIYNSTHTTQEEKLSYFLVIFIEIIVTFITLK